MNEFLNSIISLSPVLLVIMPVVGACFGWGGSKMGLEFNRWTTFSNTLITVLILVAVIVAPFIKGTDNDSRQTRSISVTLKLPSTATTPSKNESASERVSARTLKWTIDPVAVWFLMLPVCLWPALVFFSNRSIEMTRLHYFLLMILQSTINGLFVSSDLMSFISFFTLTTFCLLCMIRLWSDSRSRRIFESTMYLQFLGDGLIIGGLFLAAVAFNWMQGILLGTPQTLTFQFDHFLKETVSDIARYPLAAAYWSSISPWILVLLLSGFTFKGALFPLHYGLTQWLAVSSSGPFAKPHHSGWNLILLTLLTKISIYGMIRFMIPLNFTVGSSLISVLSFWGCCGFLFAALIASRRTDLLQIIVWFLIGQTVLTLTILFAVEPEAISSFTILNVIQGIACCLLLLVTPLVAQQNSGSSDRLLKLVVTLSVMTLIGIPGLGGFTAQFAFIWSLINQSVLVAFCYILGTLIFSLSFIRTYWEFLKTERTDTVSTTDFSNERENENSQLTCVAFGPALLLILLMGISPVILLEKTSFALREIKVPATEDPANRQ